MLDVTLFGMKPGPHHLVSALLHAIAAALLYLALRNGTSEPWPSAFVAALFAVHPLRVESVAWAAQRKDVLAGCLFMAALLAYIQYARRPRLGSYLLVLVLFALGLGAKSTVVTLPFVLLLFDLWPLGRWADRNNRGRLVLEKLPLLALAAAVSAITFTAQKSMGVVRPADLLPWSARVANASSSYVAYLWKAVWPTDLAVFYPLPARVASWSWPLACCVGVLVVSVLAILTARCRPYLAVGWFWYIGTLVPVIGLVQVGTQAMADRYAYLPLVGITIAVAWSCRDLLVRWPRAKLAVLALACAVIVGCAVLTWKQLSYWRDSRALFEHALRVVPSSYVAHNGLGMVAVQSGNLAQARAHFRRAVELKPDYAFAHNNLAGVLARQGDLSGAEAGFREVLRMMPQSADTHYNLGLVLEARGDLPGAAAQFVETLRIEPAFVNAREALARVRGDGG